MVKTIESRFLRLQAWVDRRSRGILDRALAGDSMRNTRRLLVTGQLERRELSVGLPSSTPAFQASIMYGVRPDIPGFHYYDKREGLELHFPERGRHRALRHGRPRRRRELHRRARRPRGPSEEELHTFILHPPSVRLPAEPLTHPVDLYLHFRTYREAEADEVDEPVATRSPACAAR